MLRRVGTGWMDGRLSLPAGALEAGETLREAAAREVKEEVGANVRSTDLRLAHTLHSRTDGSDWTGHFFIAERWHGELKICEPEKHAELRWELLSEVPPDAVPYVHQALKAIDRGEAYSEYGWTPRGA